MHNHHPHHHDLRSLRIALVATVTIAAVQLIGSLLSSSLALLTDSVHMAIDISSLLIAYVSLRLAQCRAHMHRFTYGWRRVEILAALLNGVALLAICVFIAVEALERLSVPHPIHTTPMLLASTVGLVANGIAWFALRHATHLTTRSAYLHVLTDMLSSLAVITGGIVMWLSGWHLLDPILSLLITVFIIRNGIQLIRQAVTILMETAPPHLEPAHLRQALSEHPQVRSVHDLHVWQLGATSHAMSAHIVVDSTADRDQTLSELQTMLGERFGIHHATLQLEGKHYSEQTECYGCEQRDPFVKTAP